MLLLCGDDLLYCLDRCPWCGAENIDILHPFLACRKTSDLYHRFASDQGALSRPLRSAMVSFLFGFHGDTQKQMEIVNFVGGLLLDSMCAALDS